MINTSRDACIRIHEIHRDAMKAIDNSGFTSNFDFIDILDLNNIVNTHNVLIPSLCQNIFYWKFLDNWLHYMKTGIWTIIPRLWYETMCGAKGLETIPDFRLQDEYDGYLRKRAEVCKLLNVSHLESNDKQLRLAWIQRKNGEQGFLEMAYTMMRIFVYMNDLTLEGLNNNASSRDTSFNSADQSMWPTDISAAEQLGRSNAGEPWKANMSLKGIKQPYIDSSIVTLNSTRKDKFV